MRGPNFAGLRESDGPKVQVKQKFRLVAHEIEGLRESGGPKTQDNTEFGYEACGKLNFLINFPKDAFLTKYWACVSLMMYKKERFFFYRRGFSF